jgi:hypothetical protein
MAEEDLRVRTELEREGVLFDGYHPRMEVVHRRNAKRLLAILSETGWPGRSTVGEDGARAAWLVLQHSIGTPQLMRRGLTLVQESVRTGEATPTEAAMLEDRIRILSGLPQIYGTQFDWDENGVMNPEPIEEADTVDARRGAIGLPPLADRLREIRDQVARSGEKAPSDLHARRREKERWAREVGWRNE